MTRFEELDDPFHPDYISPQYGPGEWTFDHFFISAEADETGTKVTSSFVFHAELVTVCHAFFHDCVRKSDGGRTLMDHSLVEKRLIEAGVCDAEQCETESGSFWLYCRNREEAQGFIDRFNTYLQKRLDEEPETRELHEKLCGLRRLWEAQIRSQIQESLSPNQFVQELIELSSTRNPRQAFRHLRERFLKLCDGEQTSEISALLRGLADLSNEMSPLLLVGALRVTYLYRDDIPGWRESMNRMEKSLEVRGFNVQSLLVGLKQ